MKISAFRFNLLELGLAVALCALMLGLAVAVATRGTWEHRDGIVSIDFSPDSHMLVACYSGRTGINFWNLEHVSPRAHRIPPRVRGRRLDWRLVRWASSSELAVVADRPPAVSLLDINSLRFNDVTAMTSDVFSLDAAAGRITVMAWGQNDSGTVLNHRTKRVIAVLKPRYLNCYQTQMSHDGRVLANREDWDKITITIWDLREVQGDSSTSITARELKLPLGWGRSFALSPSGDRIAVPWNDEIGIWDTATLERTSTIVKAGSVHDLQFSPDGKQLAAASVPGPFHVYDLEDRTARQRRVPTSDKSYFAWRRVAYSPDGRSIAAAEERRIAVFDATSLQPRFELHASDPAPHFWVLSAGCLLWAAGFTAVLSRKHAPRPTGQRRERMVDVVIAIACIASAISVVWGLHTLFLSTDPMHTGRLPITAVPAVVLGMLGLAVAIHRRMTRRPPWLAAAVAAVAVVLCYVA